MRHLLQLLVKTRAMQLQPLVLLLACPLLVKLSACIVIPTQFPDAEPFDEQRLTFIEIGKSSKEEIATAMSDFAVDKDGHEVRIKLSPQKYRGGDWWLYALSREELRLFVGVAAYGGSAAESIGDRDYRFLLIKFDDNGIVAGYDLFSSEGYGCSRESVCIRAYRGEFRYTLLASEDEDRVVKQFDISADRCGVYLYGKPRTAIPIWLDGHHVGWLLSRKQFFFWQLDQGMHQLGIYNPDVEDQRSIEFSCTARGLYFFELTRTFKKIGRRYRTQRAIEHRDAVEGRKAISKRQLTLNITESVPGRLRAEIPMITRAELDNVSFQSIGSVSATSCFNNFINNEAASQDHALHQLRYKVDQIGGNALLAPSCESEGISLAKNCWSSITCTGFALRIGESPSISETVAGEARSGTCFFVAADGVVLTSAHVVSGASDVQVVTADGQQLPAQIDQLSRSTDIAVLSVGSAGFPYLPLTSSDAVQTGDRVFTLGYLATEILAPKLKFTDGSISSLTGVGGEASLMQITVPVQPGNSGGPLVTESGQVIGIIASTAAVEVFFRATGSLPQNINWAVKSDYAAPVGRLSTNKSEQLSRDEAIARAKSAVCRIEAKM